MRRTVLISPLMAATVALAVAPAVAHPPPMPTVFGHVVSDDVQITVTWPKAPVRGKRAVVRVSRTATGPVTLALVSIRPRANQVLAERRITGRRTTFRLRLAHNRTQLQVWADTPDATTESRIARSPLPRLRHGTRRYGQGPLRARRAGQSLAVRFQGRRGQVVGYGLPGDSCDTVELRRRSDALAPWTTLDTRPGRGQVWRLPSAGRFTLRTRACWDATPPSRLQLVHYRIRRMPDDGRAVTLKTGARRVDVRRLDPVAERFMLRADREGGPTWTVLDAAGDAQSTTSPLHVSGATLSAFLFPRDRTTARLSTPMVVAVEADGTPMSTEDQIPGRERALQFAAKAGSTVTLTALDGVRDVQLIGPGGVVAHDPESASWTTEVDGVHYVLVTPLDPAATLLRVGVTSATPSITPRES